MKKYLLITSMILALSNVSYAENINGYDFAVTPADLEGGNFYRSPSSNAMIDPDTKDPEYDFSFDQEYGISNDSGMRELKDGEMPLFKQVRVFLTKKARKFIPTDEPATYEEQEDENFENDLDLDEDKNNVNVSQKQKKSIGEKLKFWKKKKDANATNGGIISEEGSLVDTIQNEIESSPNPDETLSLETGISEHVTEKELTLDADNVNFDEETGDMIAKGRPIMKIPPQNTTVIADTMTYNQDSNIIKGLGDVVIIKDGLPTTADYAEVDMNEERMFADNVKMHSNLIILEAEKAVQSNDTLTFTNGNMHSDVSRIYSMTTRMIGPRFDNFVLPFEERALFFGDPSGNKITLNIDKIYVTAGKQHDKFTAKHIEFTRKGKHWFTWPSMTAYVSKDRDYFEANYPELGSRRKVGFFIGPGVTFPGPGGSIIKAIPFLNYQKGKIGFGGALKYHNKFNYTEFGYASTSDIFFLRGHQRLDDHLYLRYGANTFIPEWFLGSRMPKYMVEAVYDRGYLKKDFLAKNRDLSFRHTFGAGLMEDNDRNYYGEKFEGKGISTTRFRYMAALSQNLYNYANHNKGFYVGLNLTMQGSAAVYGTGDTQFIGRIGPLVHMQYKNWMQDLAYFQTAYDDHTPMPRYDAYRYGHSSVYIAEMLRVHKYLSVGWAGTLVLSGDYKNGQLFKENMFMVAVGPDDIKVRLGYDFVRKSTYFGFNVAFDTKGTSINYKRMEIKNPEMLGKTDKSVRKLAFSPASLKMEEETKSAFTLGANEQKPSPKVLDHAQVIEIEDPDKETVD